MTTPAKGEEDRRERPRTGQFERDREDVANLACRRDRTADSLKATPLAISTINAIPNQR